MSTGLLAALLIAILALPVLVVLLVWVGGVAGGWTYDAPPSVRTAGRRRWCTHRSA